MSVPDSTMERNYTSNSNLDQDLEQHPVGVTGSGMDHGVPADPKNAKDDNNSRNPATAPANTAYTHKPQAQGTVKASSSISSVSKASKIYGRGPNGHDTCRCPQKCFLHPPAIMEPDDDLDAEGEHARNMCNPHA